MSVALVNRLGRWADNDRSWQAEAECQWVSEAESDRLFFGDDNASPAVSEAVSDYCDYCPVRERCLEFAVRNGHVGIWGGQHIALGDLSRLRRQMRHGTLHGRRLNAEILAS